MIHCIKGEGIGRIFGVCGVKVLKRCFKQTIYYKQYFSGSEIDIHSTGDDGVQAQVSVYSKIKIRAEDGTTKVSSLEAPSGKS